ncbi:unnamed protein product [Fraxinus pennsylvanica]|uniref:Pentatricopeptide repeat-containing protein n=1 Tax=Fraxinus pennsylvanica TaxID=56036 RepID=A0AAD2E6S5_9LAMI|nr:unnamed protein product [Fraxinus pennsylvanica]
MEAPISLNLKNLQFSRKQRATHDWDSIIKHQAKLRNDNAILTTYTHMESLSILPNTVTLPLILKACGNLYAIETGKKIHNDVMNTGYCFEALDLFVQMLMNGMRCDLVTILSAIQAIAEYRCVKLGMQVHQLAIKCDFNRDLYIINALINMYSQIGCMEFAHVLFRSVSTGDVALWNSMVSAYTERGAIDEAVALLRAMKLKGTRPDERTVVIVLSLCVDLANGLRNGRSLHAHVVKCGMENNACIRNALLNLFGELNCVEDALKIFDETKNPDVLSWNTLILTLARNELRGKAWDLFMQMSELHFMPNSHTIVSILAACTDESFLKLGRFIHGYVIKHGIKIDPPLHTALTEMYMNCIDKETAETWDVIQCWLRWKVQNSTSNKRDFDARRWFIR